MDIRISGVAKIFPPDIVALEDIYLTVSRGEFVYFVGTTGSGKTTLSPSYHPGGGGHPGAFDGGGFRASKDETPGFGLLSPGCRGGVSGF